jgi:hypothetical protein
LGIAQRTSIPLTNQGLRPLYLSRLPLSPGIQKVRNQIGTLVPGSAFSPALEVVKDIAARPATKKRAPHWTIVFAVYPLETDLKRVDTDERELLGTKTVVKILCFGFFVERYQSLKPKQKNIEHGDRT